MSKSPSSDAMLKPVLMSFLTIGTKLVLTAVLPLLLFAAFTFWLHHQLQGIETSVQQAATHDIAMTLLAKDLQRDVVQVQQFLSDVSATRGQDGLDDGFNQAQAYRDAFMASTEQFRIYLSEVHDEAKLQELARMRQHFEVYYAKGVDMAKLYVTGGPDAGNKAMPEFDKASETLQRSLDAIVKGQLGRMTQTLSKVQDNTGGLRWMALGLGILLGALLIAANWVIHRSIVRPIQVASDVALRISRGDLRHKFLPKSQDEIGVMLDALSRMQDELRHLVTRVRVGVEEVHATSSGMSSANGDLSTRTEQQAAALEQTAASMHQLGSTVRQNAENAVVANQRARYASGVAVEGGQVMAEVVSTMKSIRDASGRVSDIIGVIDGIAFQTNILALNAAVEAARAGEQGRGFAVVAGEVRSLAGRSAAAAREIKQLIASSLEQVEQGAVLVDKAGATMNEVVNAIAKVTNLVDDISTASHEQTTGLNQVVEAVAHIDLTTQQNAGLVEQNASTAERLKLQASELVEAISVFALDEARQVS